MRPTSGFIARLDAETRSCHSKADAPWFDLLLDREVTRARYVDLLKAAYGFEAPVEAALAYTPPASSALALRDGFRAGLIAQDLLTLDFPPRKLASIPQCAIAPFTCLEEALGWMYVLERSTMLHDTVYGHLVQRAPHLAGSCSYLAAHRKPYRARWPEFRDVLAATAATPGAQSRILGAAHDGFRGMAEWFGEPAARSAEQLA